MCKCWLFLWGFFFFSFFSFFCWVNTIPRICRPVLFFISSIQSVVKLVFLEPIPPSPALLPALIYVSALVFLTAPSELGRPNGGICSLHLWVCWRSPEHRQLSSQKDESVECENWKMMKMLLLFRDVISICSRSRLCNSVCKKKPKPTQVGKLRWKLWGEKKRI